MYTHVSKCKNDKIKKRKKRACVHGRIVESPFSGLTIE
jgi:hypothetical protein